MIVFDEQKDLAKVERYDQTTGITTLLSLSNFDLFDLGAEVGDSMCFGYGWWPWHNLYLSISTALNINATLTWYYLEDAGVWKTLTITTDGTNGFTQSGWIEFDCPPQMNQGYQKPGYLTFAIKCEITAFTSITTVGHVNATPQINNFAITITGTETMSSIKAANDSGSWGVVDRDGDRYKIWCNLYLDGNLISLDELVEIGDENVGRYFATTAISVLQLGDEDGNGKSIDGSIWRYTNNAFAYPYVGFRGILKMYVSEFYHDSPSGRDMYFYSSSVLYFKDSIFRTQMEKWLYGSITVINSVLWTPTRHYIGATTLVLDNVKFIMNSIWSAPNISFTIKNTDLSASYFISIIPYGAASIITMEDCDLGEDFGAKIDPYVNGTGIVKYNLNLTIHDKDGIDITPVNLKIENSDDTEIYNGTYSSGDILLEVYKKIEVSSVPTIYDYNPFKITINKAGYATYQDVVTIKKRTEQCIAFQEPIYYQHSIDASVSQTTVKGSISSQTTVRGTIQQ